MNEEKKITVQKEFLAYMPRLRGFIAALAYDPHIVDDILNEVFIKTMDRYNDFKPGSDFGAWVRTLAWYRVKEMARTESSPHMLIPAETLESLAGAYEEDEDRWDRKRSALKRCIEKLGKKMRRMMELRYGQGLSLDKVSEAMKWTKNAIKVALARTKKALRECVEKAESIGTR